MIIALQTLIYFRESLISVLDRILRPYYKRFSLGFIRNGEESEEEEPDEQVFSEFDDEKGVIFFPPVYAQRYAAVSDCLMDERWRGKLEKVVDFGYHDMSFIKYLKEVPGIQQILGVDLESMPLRCSSDLFAGEEYAPKRESPLQITLFQGNAADPDYRLIGCDAVIAIEMIEHMLPHDLDRLVHNVFGFIKPWIVVFTTPNGDFNVLFKSLGKNGFRRWDHFFEWSREQFSDWCSNIIARYPSYSVTCQGIGPGPPGTLHHGCCSQLALFVNNDYHKQQDLNLNSLALVTVPSPPPTNDLTGNWDTPMLDNDYEADLGRIEAVNGVESLTEFLCNEHRSNFTFVYTPALTSSMPFTPAYPESELSYSSSDKVSQCDLDSEYGKSFLMFNEDEYLDVRIPRRKMNYRVYEIEDVACRLNCSTLQVKTFSKTTQNMMAKNKIDSLIHTREVVDEIRHLTKALKFNKCIMDRAEDDSAIWCNINWGDDAPYWNQYYKVVKEYHCPFETKSEECRILDLISDEINRMIDIQFDEEMSCDVNRLEIPLSHLMTVVEHISNDVDKVRDILEWNGYEIVDDVVIHSRLVVDTLSVATHDEDWQDNGSTFSDWDNVTEVQSTTVSDGSTIVPDYQDRCLRRALDHKLRNLRTMLTADEDITTELDKVVCKLMKIALRSSRRRTTPPPAKWMQCKLLDLLTLTEKAIQRRKKHDVTENSLKAITFDLIDNDKMKTMESINAIRDDVIEDFNKKCDHITGMSEVLRKTETLNNSCNDVEPEDDPASAISDASLKDFESINRTSPNPDFPVIFDAGILGSASELNPMERTEAWLNDDVEVAPYPNLDIGYDNINYGDTENAIKNEYKQKLKQKSEIEPSERTACKTFSKTSFNKCKPKRKEKKRKTSSTRVTKKVIKKISANYDIVKDSKSKNHPVSINNYDVRLKKTINESRCLNVMASKPIPESLIDLCHPELKVGKCITEFCTLNVVEDSKIAILNQSICAAAEEESLLNDIIMDDTRDLIPVCTDKRIDAENAELSNTNIEQVDVLSNDIDRNLCTRHEVSMEKIHPQTIFLNDINEPSTSKGIRHNVSIDAQCGPDALAAYPTLSASTSLVRIPPVPSTGIQIHDGTTGTVQGTDFGTSTADSGYDKIISLRSRSIGIKIKDSDINICPTIEISTMTQENAEPRNRSPGSRCWSTCPRSWSPESNMIVPVNQVSFETKNASSSTGTECLNPTSNLNTDSGSEFCGSFGSFRKFSSPLANSSKTGSEIVVIKPDIKERKLNKTFLDEKCSKPRLSCGGVHVHSYKDKQESEDIVFQGHWQRCRPTSVRKKAHNTIVAKKNSVLGNRKQKDIKDKRVNSKDKISIKKSEKRKETKIDPRKTLQMRNSRLQKPKLEVCNETKNNNVAWQSLKTVKVLSNSARVAKQSNNVIKVSSKIVSSIVSKNTKSSFTSKKPQLTTTTTNNKSVNNGQSFKKIYIPTYLKKRIAELSAKRNLNKSIDSVDTTSEMMKNTISNKLYPPVRAKSDLTNKDLLDFQVKNTDCTYLVFRNEMQENNVFTNDQIPNTPNNEGNAIQNDSFINQTRSRQSLNSSTCSSPNSIVTVRAVTTKSKNLSSRRHSASSYKSSLNTSESDNPTSTKNKKVIIRCKTGRKADSNKDANNKENIPETTENFASKESNKVIKSPFVGHHKNICIAQLKTDRSSMQTTTSKHRISNKPNIIIPTPVNTVENKPSPNASVSRRSVISGTSSKSKMDRIKNISTERSNMVLVLQPQDNLSALKPVDSEVKSVDKSMLAEWIQNSHLHSEANNISCYIIEELLDFINYSSVIDSRSKILISDNTNSNVNCNDSISSYETVTTDYLNFSLCTESDNRNLNRIFDPVLGDESIISLTDTRLTVTDSDLVSFKSITSVSKDSEYFLADSDFNTDLTLGEDSLAACAAVVPTSVTGIFERKEQLVGQNPTGVLANQAFSGFSIDEPVFGQRPDPVALIDSETGSMALGRARQATSEEVFVSGRSSESFQSCVIDEDAVVPNWLFQIISQQHSLVEDGPIIGPLPEPMGEDSIYDVNGNAIEPGMIGVAAGAGDGRGIHSDQSQDSSGRGTSLSSSDTSSSTQSDVILIDPSTFTAQFELTRDPATSSVLAPEDLDNSREENLGIREDTECVTLTGHSRRRPRTRLNEASDISADISSIDTDIPDSSDD